MNHLFVTDDHCDHSEKLCCTKLCRQNVLVLKKYKIFIYCFFSVLGNFVMCVPFYRDELNIKLLSFHMYGIYENKTVQILCDRVHTHCLLYTSHIRKIYLRISYILLDFRCFLLDFIYFLNTNYFLKLCYYVCTSSTSSSWISH